MDKTILEVKNVSVYFEQHKKNMTKAVTNVSFSIAEGEILGLVGESGCGKTTLSKAILGFVKCAEGSITLNTGNPQMIFQDPYSSLNPSKKIGWILEEPLKLMGKLPKEERKEKVLNMLRKIGLDEKYADRYPKELSGGQRQRVSIGAALLAGAKFIIADEAVSALDVTVQAQIIKLLKEVQKEFKIAILFISHDLKVVYQICDRVMVMKDGSIIEQNATLELYENPKNAYTKLLLGTDTILKQ